MAVGPLAARRLGQEVTIVSPTEALEIRGAGVAAEAEGQ